MDGILSNDEWGDVNFIEIDTYTYIITIYFKHNGNGLFIGFDIPDITVHPYDDTYIGLDVDHDGEASENDYVLTYWRDGGSSMLEGPDRDLVVTPFGFEAIGSSNINGWQVEYNITYELLNIIPGESKTIGISFQIDNNHQGFGTVSYWPEGSAYYDSASYGDISSPDNWMYEVNILPTAIATSEPTNGEAPLEVNFFGIGEDSDGSIISYQWDFDDGDSSNEQNPIHTFNSQGIYYVVLSVTDDDNGIGNDSISITVTKSSNGGNGNNGNNGGDDPPKDGKNDDGEKSKSFIPGFDFISLMCGILILTIFFRKKNLYS